MAKELNRLGKIRNNLQSTYRLVVMNDEAFEEIASYRITQLNIYVLISSFIVAISLVLIVLIVATPLKQYIPGYGDLISNEQYAKVVDKVNDLESELKSRDIYLRNIKKMLMADVEVAPKERPESLKEVDTVVNVDPIPEDYELREAVARDELLFETNRVTENQDAKKSTIDPSFFVSPIKGAVVSDVFQPERNHFGVDLIAPTNTTIMAAMDGRVILSDWTYETGYVVGIQHDNNVLTFYKHNSKLLKNVGESVQAGDPIAIIGNTGSLSYGAHLHFELWHHSSPVNPNEYISF